jgi:hypothetical protein
MNSLVQNQHQYPDPFAYFANTPRSIEKRKRKANNSSMKIINFIKNDDGSFSVYIKGTRGIYYQVFFSESAITCSCPDFEKHTVKPICKHMFKLICISENHDIFNNSMLLSDLMNPQYLERILTSILRIIDIKKMERYGGPQNQISIERDEYCPICYGNFNSDIAECSKCKHVFHQNCIRLSWNSASYLSRGRCPMCREQNSFPTFGSNNSDPWEIYNFPPQAAIEEEPVIQEPLAIEEAPAAAVEELLAVEEAPVIQETLAVQEPHAIQEALVQPALEVEQHNVIENDGQDNQNTPPFSLITNQSSNSSGSALFEQDDFDVIERRIIILNISVFILETYNIIINNIFYPNEQPE